MTIEQALKVLIDATATISTDRRGHQAIAEALKVIEKALIIPEVKDLK